MGYLLALDQGTSSSRAVVFDAAGRSVAQAQEALPQHFPQPGWVEHDALEIWRQTLATARAALQQAGLDARDVHALGISNQRETTVLWDRRTGIPVHHAIVWQDRRGEPLCAALRAQGQEASIRARTGLPLDAYFSATKLRWLLDHVPGARARADRGELAFGTIDSWLIWQLTQGAEHLTDVSNAARTLLFDIHTRQWDDALLRLFDIPHAVLPQVRPSAGNFGQVHPDFLGHALPICGVAGDQQSALMGQACFQTGMAKNTYGTGCFLLMHSGDQCLRSDNGLISTCAAQADGARAYALEGSVFAGGSVVQWLRDGLHAIDSSAQVQALAQSVPDAGGVMLVPAFTGLGAPYWKPDARASITGLSRGSTLAHIARAALESIAFQSAALLLAMQKDLGASGRASLQELRVDGGASVNDLLMQFQADLLGIPVLRPAVTETTALGAAWLAGLGSGIYAGVDELASLWRCERRFEPTATRAHAQERMAQWEHAVRQTVL